MSLQVTPSYWREEIRASQEVLRPYLGDAYERVIRNYTGGRHGEDAFGQSGDDSDPENHAFEWIALMQGQAIPGVPQIRATASETLGEVAEQAQQLELAMNELLLKSKFRREMCKVFVDYSMRWGVCLVKPIPQLGAYQYEDPPDWPQAMRLSIRDYFWDPRSLDAETRRWQGHRVRADKKDLLEDAKKYPDLGWNLRLLEQLGEVTDSDGQTDNSTVKPKIRWGGGPDREQVEYIEVWVPELELEFTPADRKRTGRASWREAGFNGIILTVPLDWEWDKQPDEAEEPWLREPRPFFGPPSGPYEFFQGYYVPDDSAPLSAVGAVENQMRYLNDLARAMISSARRWKRLVFVSNEDPDLPIQVEEGMHDGVLTTNVGDVKRGIQQVEVGGTSNEQIVATDIAKNRLDRASGVDDAQRGNVTGQGTATEVLAATQASAARVGMILGNFREGMLGVLQKMAWYVWNHHQFQIQVGPEAAAKLRHPRTGEPVRAPVIRGGSPKINPQTGKVEAVPMAPHFDAVSIQIHTFSVQSFGTITPTQQLMEFDQTAMAYMPLISNPQFLHVDWASFFADRRRLIQGADFSASIDFDLGRQVAMAQLGAQLEQSQGAQGPAQPTQAKATQQSGSGPSWRVTMKNGPQPSAYARGGLLKPGGNTKQPSKQGGAK